MINHVRTLLQNMPPEWESDEFVDPDFVPMSVPRAVDKVKTAIWGRTPVHQVTLRQLMQILHATELEEHVLAKDPRVTYLPFDEAPSGSGADLAHAVLRIEEALTPDDYTTLFGDTAQEPNRTWFNLWMDHEQLAYKLGGLLLAVADTTERARTWATPQ